MTNSNKTPQEVQLEPIPKIYSLNPHLDGIRDAFVVAVNTDDLQKLEKAIVDIQRHANKIQLAFLARRKKEVGIFKLYNNKFI